MPIYFQRNEILRSIPHGSEALLIEEAWLTPKNNILAILRCKGTESFFQGHYPNNPILPGVVLVEAFGQAGALLCSSIKSFKEHKGYLAAINKVKFRKPVYPPSIVYLEVHVKQLRSKMAILKCYAYDAEEVPVASGNLWVGFKPEK